MNQFVLVGPVDVLSQSIVIGVAHRLNGRTNSVFFQALVVDNAHILRTVISVMNQTRRFLSTLGSPS